MPTRRSVLAGLTVSMPLAGCTVIGDSSSSDESQEPVVERETATPVNESEPSGQLTILSMAPWEGWQVTAKVEMGDADTVLIIHKKDILKRAETGGWHRVAAGDDESDKLMHFEDVEEGDRFALVADYDDAEKEPIELAEEYAVENQS